MLTIIAIANFVLHVVLASSLETTQFPEENVIILYSKVVHVIT